MSNPSVQKVLGAAVIASITLCDVSAFEIHSMLPVKQSYGAATLTERGVVYPGAKKMWSKVTFLEMSSNGMDEVAELRAAAAKMREEANVLAKEMGKDMSDTASISKEAANSREANNMKTSVKKTKASKSEILSLTSSINFSDTSDDSSNTQVTKLNEMVSSGDITLWNSASSSSSTSLRTYPVTLNFLESRSGGKLTAETLGVGGEGDVSMDDFKYATLYVTAGSIIAAVVSLIVLPENIGATLCYVFAILPILFLGVGSSAPGIIAGAIQSLRGSGVDDATKIDRICRHEAGHFLCGYLCGLPIKAYEILEESGVPCVEFHSSGDTDAAAGEKGFSREEIAALSVVAMSGSVAEALQYDQAKGGENDLLELDRLFRRSEEFIGAAKQQDLTRWGALAAFQLIQQNKDRYEKLVQAFKDKSTVAECIAVIESN